MKIEHLLIGGGVLFAFFWFVIKPMLDKAKDAPAPAPAAEGGGGGGGAIPQIGPALEAGFYQQPAIVAKAQAASAAKARQLAAPVRLKPTAGGGVNGKKLGVASLNEMFSKSIYNAPFDTFKFGKN